MQLTEKQIQEFQRIYKKEFGIDISVKEALEKSLKLLRLVKIVTDELNQREYQKSNISNNNTET